MMKNEHQGKMRHLLCSLLLLTFLLSSRAFQKPTIVKPNLSMDWKKLKSFRNSALYSVDPKDLHYTLGAPLVLHLKGNRTEVGYDAGVLLGKEADENYKTFMKNKFGDKQTSYEKVLDYLYDSILKPHVPKEFDHEITALSQGSWAAGVTADVDVGQQQKRVITLATMPADVANIIRLVENDLDLCNKNRTLCDEIRRWEEKHLGPHKIPYANGTWPKMQKTNPISGHCDFLAAWGSRTEDGRLISTRNLDWDKDTGISKLKLVTVYDIDGLGSPYATVGFGALLSGAIAGMSKSGITVSEANLDNSEVTFQGFPWRTFKIIHARYLFQLTSLTLISSFIYSPETALHNGKCAFFSRGKVNMAAHKKHGCI